MLKNFVGAVWRRIPTRLRRFIVRLSNTHFAVSAGGIITNEQGQVLLLKHRFRPGSGWGIPGGFIKESEQPEAALQRELREEVGLELKQLKIFSTRAFIEPKQIEIVFQCRAVGETRILSFEIEEVGWFFPDELPEQLPKDQAQLIKRAVADGATPQD